MFFTFKFYIVLNLNHFMFHILWKIWHVLSCNILRTVENIFHMLSRLSTDYSTSVLVPLSASYQPNIKRTKNRTRLQAIHQIVLDNQGSWRFLGPCWKRASCLARTRVSSAPSTARPALPTIFTVNITDVVKSISSELCRSARIVHAIYAARKAPLFSMYLYYIFKV